MENINQIAKDILRIFEIVCVISDENELFFDDYTTLQEKLTVAKQLITNIKLNSVSDEIWNYSSFPDRESLIVDLANEKFDKLITWKPDTVSILEMSDKLNGDLTQFYSRQACVDRNYDPIEQTVINSLYKEIGQRAYKLDNDLGQIMAGLFEKIEKEKVEQGIITEQFTFNLNPEKSEHFAFLLAEMCKQNFFNATKNDDPVLEIEVLFAFGELFKCDLVEQHFDYIDKNNISIFDSADLNVFESTVSKIEKDDYIVKPFPEFLLYPEKNKLAELIRKEFSQEKGKNLRLLLKVLENQTPPLITIGYRQGKIIYKAMQQYFNWNIGSYQSIFNFKVDEKSDAQDLENISIRFKHLLNTL